MSCDFNFNFDIAQKHVLDRFAMATGYLHKMLAARRIQS